jgi:hypothetical protein
MVAVDLVLSPTAAFRELSPAGRWVLPLTAVAVLAALVHISSIPFTLALVSHLSADVSGDALGALQRWLLGISLVRAAWIAVKAAFMCWVLWLTLNLRNEVVDARRLMTVAAYASLALIAEDALRLVIFWLRGVDQIRGPQDLQSFTGLDAFVSTTGMGIAARLVLAQVSLFSLWFIAILRGGLIGLAGVGPRNATVSAVLCWVYLLLLQLGVALVIGSIQAPAASAG